MISTENATLLGGGQTFTLKIWESVKDILSEWTGQKLAYCSIYGIRVYKEHAILAPHVGTFLIRILICSKELYDL
jgi:prolyl 4-hydroxylase